MTSKYLSVGYLVEHQNDPYLEFDDGYIPADDPPDGVGLIERKPRRAPGHRRAQRKGGGPCKAVG
jgi:hypothetical protein